jgi:asparagine synthase (glutamine-hydrolysing)
MSGIAAAVCLDRPLLDPAIMPAMIDAIGYRGGDRIGTWHSGPAALGAAQLRTTAEARDELQPLACPDSLVHVVFDGFLSNWDDLRRELVSRGARLRTPSDTELVLRAYLEWGGEFATWLDGEFALIVWDARQRRLFAARDPVGARPLVYWCDGRTLLVASDPVAILAGLPERPALSSAYLVQVVTDLIYCAEDTPWDGVRRLRPAHLLRLENDRVTEERYWQPDLETHINYRRDSDYEEHYRSMLADCVRRAARSEAPTAFEVSGGLDSTSLFCMPAGDDRAADARHRRPYSRRSGRKRRRRDRVRGGGRAAHRAPDPADTAVHASAGNVRRAGTGGRGYPALPQRRDVVCVDREGGR